jgi:RimJ/RimL family protein N-acetyltransferase
MDVVNYSAVEWLRDGRRIQIRSLRPDDREDLLAAIRRTSDTSMFRRFFGAKRSFSEKEISFFVNPDFTTHVALVAVGEEAGLQVIVGGSRYIVLQPGSAELAFVVIDEYQGKGIASALLRHLAAIGHATGLNELVADVLPDNASMLKVLQNSGFSVKTKRDVGVIHVTLRLT